MAIKKLVKGKKLIEVLKELSLHPYGTKIHKELTRHIIENFNNKYRGQYVLCTKGVVQEGAIFSNDTRYINYGSIKDGLNKINVFAEGSPIYFKEREECEYNVEHRQFIVYSLVTNEDYSKVIALQDINNGLLSLPGGHVDYIKNSYHRNFSEILHYNMKKEIREEVGNSNLIIKNLKDNPDYIISSIGRSGTIHDVVHIVAAYVVKMSNEDFEKQVSVMKQAEDFQKPVELTLDQLLKHSGKNSIRCLAEIIKKRKSQQAQETEEDTVNQ